MFLLETNPHFLKNVFIVENILQQAILIEEVFFIFAVYLLLFVAFFLFNALNVVHFCHNLASFFTRIFLNLGKKIHFAYISHIRSAQDTQKLFKLSTQYGNFALRYLLNLLFPLKLRANFGIQSILIIINLLICKIHLLKNKHLRIFQLANSFQKHIRNKQTPINIMHQFLNKLHLINGSDEDKNKQYYYRKGKLYLQDFLKSPFEMINGLRGYINTMHQATIKDHFGQCVNIEVVFLLQIVVLVILAHFIRQYKRLVFKIHQSVLQILVELSLRVA